MACIVIVTQARVYKERETYSNSITLSISKFDVNIFVKFLRISYALWKEIGKLFHLLVSLSSLNGLRFVAT